MKVQKRFYILILWSAFIMLTVGIPGAYIPKPMNFMKLFSPDKIVHILLFAPFAFLLMRYLKSLKKENIFTKYYIITTIFFGIIYAISTELLQVFVFVGRNGNIYDAIADVAGVFLGSFIFYTVYKRIDAKSYNP